MMKCYEKLPKVMLSCTILLLALVNVSLAQRVVPVAPDGGGVFGRLNDAIESDTLADGSRVDPNTIYELQSGGFYLTRATIANDWEGTLTIRAEEGYTVRPVIQPLVPLGGESSRPFSPEGNLTLQGLYITNLDNGDGLKDRIIRIRADSVRIVVDDCHLDKAGQSGFRFDTEGVSVFLTNSIVSNIGVVQSIDNGRVFDDRGNNIDTLVAVNNTMYNVTQRVIRDGGGWIKFCLLTHNTFHSTLQQFLTVGEAATFVFTNNLIINPEIHGQDTSSTNTLIELDSLTSRFLIDTLGLTQGVNIRNNNFYLDPQIIALYPDSVVRAPLYSPAAAAFIEETGTGDTMIEEAIAFTSEPALQNALDLVTAFYSGAPLDSLDDGAGGVLNQLPFDFEYPNTTQSFSHGTDGLPLGDVSWHGLGPVGISDPELIDNALPASFQLRENYPNPFNPETTIEYAVSRLSLVRINIYNMLGQKVRTLVNNLQQNPGTYAVRWDGTNDRGQTVSSGIYFYRLETPYFTQTRRMLLMK